MRVCVCVLIKLQEKSPTVFTKVSMQELNTNGQCIFIYLLKDDACWGRN